MTTQTKSKPNYYVLAIIFLVIGLSGFVLARHFFPTDKRLPESLQATVLPQGKSIVGLSLRDHNDQIFTEQRFRGKWSFMFFGYTNCPDVCPTTMLIMKGMWAKLPDSARSAPEPQMFFVSVDPQRDSTAVLKEYATFYHPDFVGLTGNANQIDVLVNQVGALYGYEDDEAGKGYTVNHSAQVILIDPTGKLRAVFSPPFDINNMVTTFVNIREYFKG